MKATQLRIKFWTCLTAILVCLPAIVLALGLAYMCLLLLKLTRVFLEQGFQLLDQLEAVRQDLGETFPQEMPHDDAVFLQQVVYQPQYIQINVVNEAPQRTYPALKSPY